MSYTPKTLYKQIGESLVSAFAAGADDEAALRADGYIDYPAAPDEPSVPEGESQ